MKARLNSSVLALRCLVHAAVCGTAKKKIVPKSIVIVQFGKLGDMVCTTPMFRAVKVQDPSTRVIVVGDRVGGEVLAGNKDVDRYIVCGTSITEALQELRKEKIDAGVIASPSLRAFALLYLANVYTIVAPRVVGGMSMESRLYKLLAHLGVRVEHRMGHYAPGEYVRALTPLGIATVDTTKHLALSAEAVQWAEEFWEAHDLVGEKVVGIAPAAGNRIKQWPPERFAAVAEHLFARGFKIVVVGGKNDQHETGTMLGVVGVAAVVNTVGTLSIEQLKALIQKLSLFISVDTGPIYIAEAFGVATVDIVGPVDEREQPPIGPRHVVVVPKREKPELYVMNPYPRDITEARRQTESVTAQEVITATDTLLGQLNLL
jgi:ADP-heptose:LPS heptosyltransferase